MVPRLSKCSVMEDGTVEVHQEIASLSSGRFDAFISYSHRADDDIAPSLRDGLQRLAKPWYRRRAMRVFLDRTNMSADPALWSAITQALDTSKGFVLLMSPASANSPWVNREIEYWVERNGSRHMLPVLTSGELVWDPADGRFDVTLSTAAPPSLAGVYKEEPRYIDLRWADGLPATALSLREPRFADAIAEIAAPIRGVNKDELVGTDLREHRRTIRIARAAVGALCLLLVASLVAAAIARSNAQRADRRRIDAQASRLRVEANDATILPDLGFLLAAEAYRLRPGAATLDGVIRAAQRAPDLRKYVRIHKAAIVGLGFDASGKTLVSYDKSGELAATDWESGRTLATSKAEGHGATVVTTPKGVLVVGLSKAELRDPATLAVRRSWTAGGTTVFSGAVVTGSRLLLLNLNGSVAATTLDATAKPGGTGELRWRPVHDTAMFGGAAMPDGTFVTIGVSRKVYELVRFGVDEQGEPQITWRTKLSVPVAALTLSADGSKVVLGFGSGYFVYDSSTGAGLSTRALDSAVNALASSPAYGQYVLAANQDGKIRYIDPVTGQPYPEQIHDGRATAIAWSPSGRAATGDGDGTIALLDTGPNRLTGARSIDLAAVGVALRGDGPSAVAALSDGSVVDLGFDLAVVGSKISRRQIGRVRGASAVTESSGVVVVGDDVGTLHAVAADGTEWKTETGTRSRIAALSAIGDGIVVSRTGSLVLQSWKVEAGRFTLLRTLSDRALAHSTATSRTGMPVVAYFEGDSGIVVVNALTGDELARYQLDSPFAQIALAPDGVSVAVSDGSDVQVLSPGAVARTIRVGGDLSGLAFVAGGTQIVAFDSSSGIHVVDVASGQPSGYFHDEDGPPMSAYAVGFANGVAAVATTGSKARVIVTGFSSLPVLSDGCSFFGRKFTVSEIKRFDLDRSSDPCRVDR